MTSRLRQLLNNTYSTSRGMDSGFDPALTDQEVLAFVMGKVAQRGLAAVRGYPAAFTAPSARMRGRRKLSLGRSVTLGRHVLIDARSTGGVCLGDQVTVDDFAVLRASGVLRNLGVGITVGDRSAIGLGNFLHGGGGLTIGRDCLLGPYVTIFTENHISSDPSKPIRAQGEKRAPVAIEDDVWLGAGVTVLAGVTVGAGAIVAAGAVVTHDVSPGDIVAGVPAKRIGARDKI